MRILCHTGLYKYRIALTFVKPRGGEGQNGRLKCSFGFLVFHGVRPSDSLMANCNKITGTRLLRQVVRDDCKCEELY